MSIIQGSSLEILVRAFASGVPVTGLVDTDFLTKAWWPGRVDLLNIIPQPEDLVEIGSGLYAIKVPGVTTVQGELSLTVAGTLFDDVEKNFTIIPAPISSLLSPELCVVSGNIVDVGGAAGKGQTIRLRPSSFPSEENGSIITSDAIETTPDFLGNFSLPLVRNQTLTIEITRTGIRVQITIPDQETANLIDLLPPLS